MWRVLLLALCAACLGLAAQPPVILVFGDSLSAGYGLPQGKGWVDLLQQRLEREGYPYRVVNASISGETTLGGRNRLAETLAQQHPAIVVLELGANDGLRGLELDSTRANLEAIVRRARAARPGLRIVLAGMEVPPNLGPRYAAGFRALFPALAAREGLPLIPFLLQGVGGVDSLNQADGIHPNVAGARIVADNVWRVLEPLVTRDAAGPGAR